MYSCRKPDTSSLVFIWFVQIWILQFIVRPTRFEFIMQPSTQIRKLFTVHKLWVLRVAVADKESVVDREKLWSATGFPFPLHTYMYQCNKAGNMLLLLYLSINISGPMVALSSFYLIVSKFKAIYKDTTCLDSILRFKP